MAMNINQAGDGYGLSESVGSGVLKLSIPESVLVYQAVRAHCSVELAEKVKVLILHDEPVDNHQSENGSVGSGSCVDPAVYDHLEACFKSSQVDGAETAKRQKTRKNA